MSSLGPTRRVIWALALLLVASASVGWLWWKWQPRPLGVLLITLDTTRADRLTMYGYMDASMPHLERLAREGVVFDAAISAAPMSLAAHTSLLTGLLPPRHGVRENLDPPLSDHHTTLAELLQEWGFRTAAFVSSVVLAPGRGLQQGFDHYAGVVSDPAVVPARRQRRGDEVVAEALASVDEVDSPFFLWAHLFDPHRPYDPPEPFGSTYAAHPYVGEIAFADSQIGRLLDALERRQLFDRTIVVVAGDHGESLGEHGERDHGVFLYENVLRVPLIIRAPGVPPRRVGSVVRLVDVMPTVLELLGIPLPSPMATLDGQSLVGLMTGVEPEADREAFAESMYPRRLGWSPLRSLRDGRLKVIDAPRPELYDLSADPFEARNLYDEQRPTAEALLRRVRAIAGDSLDAEDGEGLPDAKDCLGVNVTPPPSCGARTMLTR